MPRKRIRGKKVDSNRPRMQVMHLLHGFCLGGDWEGPSPFKSEEDRRSYWDAWRTELLGPTFKGRGFSRVLHGERPDAWWCYDAPEGLEKPEGGGEVQEWEVLLGAGILEDDEREVVKRAWLKELEDRQRGFLGWAWDDWQAGREPLHMRPRWDTLKARLERQAALLGPDAVRALGEVIANLDR